MFNRFINKNSKRPEIPVFFASDDNYVPCLVVSIQSLIDTSSIKNLYSIYVLNTGLKNENKQILKNLERENIKIKFVNVSGKVKSIMEKLKEQLRDYYSTSIYYRIFISTLFPKYKKALYLDCDITILRDIADLYNHDLGTNLLGGVIDEVVANADEFHDYVARAVGVEQKRYINSGILIMNLEEFRKEKIEKKFLYLLNNYPFSSLCPDQDYLNILCKDRILYIERGWDRMPIKDETFDDSKLYLVHYNMFQKPWKYSDVLYDEYFWKVAKNTQFYDHLRNCQATYTKEQKEKDMKAGEYMLTYAKQVAEDPNNFKNTFERDCIMKKYDQSKYKVEEVLNFMFDEDSTPAY